MFLCASCQDDFSLWVAQFAERGRGYVEGHVDFRAEHGGGGIDLLDVYEDSWPEPDLVEGVVVFAECL